MPCDEARDIIGIDPQYSKVKYMDPYRIYENVWNSTYFQTNSCGIIWTDPPKNFVIRVLEASIIMNLRSNNVK
jgi:hypothetical protein